MLRQGAKANKQGNILEETVETVFAKKGFEIVKFSDWKKTPLLYGQEVLFKNVPFTTIYSHKGYTEFLLRSAKYNINIRIECKWQQSKGSVDEKLPYLYLNCVEAMPENNIVVVLDGNGWKQGAREWLKEAVCKKKYSKSDSSEKDIKVFNLAEFITWANNTFLS